MSGSALDRDEERYGRAGAASSDIYGTLCENRGVSKALDHVEGEWPCDEIEARVQLAIDRAVAEERARLSQLVAEHARGLDPHGTVSLTCFCLLTQFNPGARRGSQGRPCEYCGQSDKGSSTDNRGFQRCNSCGEPGQ